LKSFLQTLNRGITRRTPQVRGPGLRFWSKHFSSKAPLESVSRAALHGASTEELLYLALQSLSRSAHVSRLGIWIESESVGTGDLPASSVFQGLVWDEEGSEVPSEWSRLSPEAPLPQELLRGLATVEQDFAASREIPMIGPLLGLQRVLWVPLQKNNHLRGVILLGNRKKLGSLPRSLAESAAAELELAFEFAEQRNFALARSADISFSRLTLSALGTPTPIFNILSELAESCTLHRDKNGPGAAFAVIGAGSIPASNNVECANFEFLWKSGDPQWTSAVESEPLASIWRKALESHRLIGSDPGVSWSRGEISRVVAIPLEAHSEVVGVLVVGLPRGAGTLATLDRLEFRATLAGLALERRKAEQAQATQSAWQQSLLEHYSGPAFLLDARGTVLWMSKLARELLGQSNSAPESPHISASARPPFAELFRSRSQQPIELFCRNLFSGMLSPRNLPEAELSNGVKIKIRSAIPAGPGTVVVLLDSLEHQYESESGERAEIELHNVLEWLEEGVVLFDAQENVRAVNTRFEQIAGLAPQESGKFQTLDAWIARLELQAAEPAAFAERWRELARRIEGGVREELQMAHPAPRILERASRPVVDLAGRRLGRLEIYRDLTAQRVFQSKLLQTEKLAALGQMVTGVAHELSGPLTSILGNAQRLLLRGEDTANTTGIRQIFQEAERASGILRQLLLTAREVPPERRPVALNQVVQRALEVQSIGLSPEKISMQLDLDPVLPYVLGDAGQLQQVLMNLVANARQAIEHSGEPGTIILRTRRTGERFLQLAVIDSGPGIPHSIQARIFDPFFTTKPAGVGTGLGLAVVLGIVREHGGNVQLSTPPGGGAAFSIELPALAVAPVWKETDSLASRPVRSVLVPSDSSSDGSHLQPPRTPGGEPGRVLVVEDEPTVARLIADVLEEEGLRVDVILDGREALERARRETFDLVICDMKMPGIDGQHFYNSLARAGSPLTERFLFVTGDIIAPATHEFLARNHLPHVAKPFRVEELTEKVRRMLPHSHRGVSASAVVKRNVAGKG
jgi:signal transduction histidine kinase/CheY-like chemotaxis protein